MSLAHGATPDHQPIVDLTLTYDAFGVHTRWAHTPHGWAWVASAVHLPEAGWRSTRLTQAVRLASQRPSAHHLVRGQQRCVLYLWAHRDALHLLLAGPGMSPVSEVHTDLDAGREAAADHFTNLIAQGWRPAPPPYRALPGDALDLDRSSHHG